MIEDDFEAFCVTLEADSLVEMRVSVIPREDVSQPTSFVPELSVSPILPEIPPPAKKRKPKSDSPQKVLLSATDAKAGATAIIPTNKGSGLTHMTLDKARASTHPLLPLPASGQNLTGDQQSNAPTPKLKPKRNRQPISCT